jgi:hypothetical protein
VTTSITEIETYGVERIPDSDRTARPIDLFRLAFGGANTFPPRNRPPRRSGPAAERP